MAFDPLSAGIGLGVGVLAALFVRELSERRIRNQERSKLTAQWSLADLGGGPARLCTPTLGSLDVPPGSQVLVARGAAVPPEVARRCEVRVAAGLGLSFALAGERAILFPGAARAGALALWTREEPILERLAAEWRAAWERSEPLVPRVRVAELAAHLGEDVEVVATVSDVAERDGVKYLRLLDAGYTATLASPGPAAVAKGGAVRAVGRVERVAGGREPVLRASRVEPLDLLAAPLPARAKP